MARLLLPLVLLLLASLTHPAAAATMGDGFVARVYYDTIEDIGKLVDYDVWEFNDLEHRYVLVSMDRAVYTRLLAEGWRLEIDDAASAMLDPVRLRSLMDGYRDVDSLYAGMNALEARFSGIVDIVDYGDSYCLGVGGCVTPGGEAHPGYDLRAVRVTNEALSGPKPVFFLMANIHAREITTPEVAMRWLDWLASGYGVDPDITWVVDHHELWVVPTANPDGRWLVDLGLEGLYGGSRFFQRKNANRDNGCDAWPPSSFSQYGIDLNRNHSFEWNTGGSSGSVCAETYRGPYAASEPEVDQLQTLIATLLPDQRGDGFGDPAPPDTEGVFISMHSFGEWVLRPWGTVAQPAPNAAGLKAIGDKFASYNGYTSCQSSVCLYETSGTSDEWVYGELGVPAFTFEVGNEFMPPFSDIDERQWPDNAPALLYAAKIARSPYRLAAGPDVRNAGVVAIDADRVLLRAIVDDSANGGQSIARALYSIDTPYWAKGFSPRPMRPADGANDTPIELNRAIIGLDGLSPGRHIVFVHGVDADNHRGPASAVFVDVP